MTSSSLPAIIEQRFWAKVDKSGECWLWTGARFGRRREYGHMAIGSGLDRGAHRISYELAYGPIPAGLSIDHICRNPLCVRPDHLQAVTNKQNAENRGAVATRGSGVRGVVWDVSLGKWRVGVTHHGKRYYGGSFSDIADAERAAVALRNALFTNNLADRRTA